MPEHHTASGRNLSGPDVIQHAGKGLSRIDRISKKPFLHRQQLNRFGCRLVGALIAGQIILSISMDIPLRFHRDSGSNQL